MPDLVFHFISGYFFKRFAAIRDPAVFYLGVILPDIISRPVYTLSPGLFWAVAPFHSPLVLVAICAFICMLFPSGYRKGAFAFLIAGVGLHLIPDYMQNGIVRSYFLFFPASFDTSTLNLFWPEDSLYLLPALILSAAAFYLADIVRRRNCSSASSKRLPSPGTRRASRTSSSST